MESGMGYLQIKNRIHGAIETINAYPAIAIDCFMVILDAEDRTVTEVESGIKQEIAQSGGVRCPHQIIVMKKCFETWLLGNCDYFPQSISPQFETFKDHFDVSALDPELMEKPAAYPNSTARYHSRYLAEMLRRPFNAKGFNYSKSQPGKACEKEYLNGLLRRVRQDNHIYSFKNFIDTYAV